MQRSTQWYFSTIWFLGPWRCESRGMWRLLISSWHSQSCRRMTVRTQLPPSTPLFFCHTQTYSLLLFIHFFYWNYEHTSSLALHSPWKLSYFFLHSTTFFCLSPVGCQVNFCPFLSPLCALKCMHSIQVGLSFLYTLPPPLHLYALLSSSFSRDSSPVFSMGAWAGGAAGEPSLPQIYACNCATHW